MPLHREALVVWCPVDVSMHLNLALVSMSESQHPQIQNKTFSWEQQLSLA